MQDNDPYFVPWRSEPPDYLMRPRQAMYRIRCPQCGTVGRPYYVGPCSPAVRCRSCRCRIERPQDHTVRKGRA